MSCAKIPAGFVGLKVNLVGDSKGAVTEVPSGRYFDVFPNIEYFKFPLFTQTYVWTEGKDEGSPNDEAIRFQTGEGMQIAADIGVTLVISPEPGSAKNLFLKYRRGIEEVIDSPLRNAVRDSFNRHGSKFTADQIIGDGKSELIALVYEDVKAQFAPIIQIQSLSYLKSPRPPQNVIDALNAKVQATQLAIQRENEVRTAEAEANKKIAEARGKAESILIEARAQAESNKILSSSLTPVLVQSQWIAAWDGKLPQVASDAGIIMDYRTLSK